jgi:hypothetical protein
MKKNSGNSKGKKDEEKVAVAPRNVVLENQSSEGLIDNSDGITGKEAKKKGPASVSEKSDEFVAEGGRGTEDHRQHPRRSDGR